jgi:hypothetical protein
MIIRPPQKPLLGVPINFSYSLARNLKAALIFNERSGPYCTDLAARNRTGTITNGVWRPDGVYLNGSGSYIGIPQNNSDFTSGNFTVSILCNIHSYANNDRFLETKNAYDSTTGWFLQFTSDGQYFRYFDHYLDLTYWNLQTFSTNVWAEYTFVRDNTLGTLNCFTNGLWLNVGTGLPLLESNSFPFYIGRYGGGTGNEPEMSVGRIFYWDRCLSRNEVADYYANPYAMFEQLRKRWFYVAAGGGLSIPVAMADYRQMRN